MLEFQNRTIEQLGGIREAAMRPLVDQNVGESPGERLRDHQARRVTAGGEGGRFRFKKAGEALFQQLIEPVIPGRQPRCRNVQTVFFQTFAHGPQHPGVAGQAEVITSREVREFAFAVEDVSAIHLLQCGCSGHNRT